MIENMIRKYQIYKHNHGILKKKKEEEKAEKKRQKYIGELLLVQKTDRGILTTVRDEIYTLPTPQFEQIKTFIKGVIDGRIRHKRN